ncbi:site-2 protease family protein [Patescibacteria group bacterium]|nr:site-2 protease family protein [Patescibacteria group bacterium]
MDSITTLVFQLAVLLMSVVIHEFAHGWAAFYLGDPTAKYYGRLTLNPIKHLDPFGSFIVPVLLVLFQSPVIFGWAKPVPFNPYNLSDQKYGPAKVAVAGPLANLTIALVFGLFLRFMPVSFLSSTGLGAIFGVIVFLNLLLAIFNLMPIPPLDGSKLLFAFLPASADKVRMFLEQYGTIILLFFIFFAFQWIMPLIFGLFNLIVG